MNNGDHTRPKRGPRKQTTSELAVRPGAEVEQWRFMPVMSIDQAMERREAIVQATRKLMQDGVDYGKIPGAEKPALLQPGADKLCNLFGIVIQYETTKCIEDWTGENHGGVPFFFYELKGRAYRGEFLMGEGLGSCNGWESKYKYRKGERLCPNCGKPNIRKSRDGGWYCWMKTDGCGATFAQGDPRIENQEVGRRINPDIPDSVNTILKMAAKRAKIATTINATSAAEFFTQDIEEQGQPAPEALDPDPRGFNVDIGPHQYGTRQAQEYVRDRKLEQQSRPPELNTSKSGEIKQAFQALRERIGEIRYAEELQLAGVSDPLQLRSLDKVRELYRRMGQIALMQERVA